MNWRTIRGYQGALVIASMLALLGLAACQYSVPITERPTRNVDVRLIGNWVSTDRRETIKVRALGPSAYIVSFNGILFQAFHSDFSGTPFLSVQELETRTRSYSYLTYRVSDDGTKMYLRLVNDELVPNETGDVISIQKLLQKNLENPEMFRKEDEFTKEQ